MSANAISLNTFNNSDTGYVAKLNQDNATISTAINNLLATTATAGAASSGALLMALFGFSACMIGEGSYAATPAGTNLTVAAGFAWKPSTTSVVQTPGSTSLAFASLAQGTYYIVPSSLGQPTIENSGTDALYAVVWSGSAFTSVTRLGTVFLDAGDETGLLTSVASAATYPTVLARFEAIERLLKPATDSTLGSVQPDGTTITITPAGVITATSSESVSFETNGTKNASQSLLNMIAGENITISADSAGGVTIAAASAAAAGSGSSGSGSGSGSGSDSGSASNGAFPGANATWQFDEFLAKDISSALGWDVYGQNPNVYFDTSVPQGGLHPGVWNLQANVNNWGYVERGGAYTNFAEATTTSILAGVCVSEVSGSYQGPVGGQSAFGWFGGDGGTSQYSEVAFVADAAVNGNQNWWCWIIVANTVTKTDTGIPAENWHVLQIDSQGTAITFSIDGAVVGSGTASDQPYLVGFFGWGNNTEANLFFDWFACKLNFTTPGRLP